MFESMPDPDALQELLRGLPPEEADEVLASIYDCSGAPEEESGDALAAWLRGENPNPDLDECGLRPVDEALVEPDVEALAAVLGRAPGVATVTALVELLVDTGGVARPAAGLSDAQVIEVVVAAEKVSRWMQSYRSTAVTELASRWTSFDLDQILNQPTDRAQRMRTVYDRETQTPLRAHVATRSGRDGGEKIDPRVLAEAFVTSEVALAAGTSEYQAGEWLRIGSALARGEYPRVADALHTGVLDWGKARLVVGMLSDRSAGVAAAAEAILVPEIVVPDPVYRTQPAVRARLTQILAELDPETDAKTQDLEREDRHVRTRALSQVMGELVAVLPLEQVAKIAARLDAAARKARRERDPRSPDQVRADTLAALLTTGQLHRRTPAAPAAPAAPGEADAATEAPTTPAPAAPAPAPADPASAGSAPGSAATGQPATEPTTAPTAGATAGPEADQADAGPGEPRPTSTGLPPESPFGPNPGPDPHLDDHDFRDSDDPRVFADAGGFGEVEDFGESGVQVYLFMPLETMIGLRDDPAYLDRYGPVPAALARDLAAHGTFRCAAVDDTHGTVLGLGRGTYQDGYIAGQRLQDLQRTLWRFHCSYPGCRTRTTTKACDLDHVIPWPAGPTCACNTQPLCRRHHRLKTHGHIQLEASTDPSDPPGTYHWRLPSGHRYTNRPEGLTASIADKIAAMEAAGRPVATIHPDPDEPPPF